MSKSSLYGKLRISAKTRQQIKGFTKQALIKTHQAEVRRLTAQAGGPNRPVTLTNKRALKALDKLSGTHATSMMRTYNRMLQNALYAQPKGLTDQQRLEALSEFRTKTTAWNRDRLQPFMAKQATQLAREDFVQENALAGYWQFQGAAQCQVCQEARTDPSIEVPNHPSCECERVYVTIGTLSDNPWDGGDSTADATEEDVSYA